MSIKHKLRSARILSSRDWWTLIQAWALLPLVDLGLRVIPFHRIKERVAPASQPSDGPGQAADNQEIEHTWRMVDIASRYHLRPMTCLRRSLVLQWLLNRRGIPATLRFGVRKEEGQLHAHAWLEHQDVPIGEPPGITERYAPLTPREIESWAPFSASPAPKSGP